MLSTFSKETLIRLGERGLKRIISVFPTLVLWTKKQVIKIWENGHDIYFEDLIHTSFELRQLKEGWVCKNPEYEIGERDPFWHCLQRTTKKRRNGSKGNKIFVIVLLIDAVSDLILEIYSRNRDWESKSPIFYDELSFFPVSFSIWNENLSFSLLLFPFPSVWLQLTWMNRWWRRFKISNRRIQRERERERKNRKGNWNKMKLSESLRLLGHLNVSHQSRAKTGNKPTHFR